MSRLVTSGFELNTGGGAGDADVVTATHVTQSSTNVHSGVYSCRVNPVASTEKLQYSVFGTNQSTIAYVRFWIYIVAYPAATTRIAGVYSSANSLRSGMLLSTVGTLQTVDSGGGVIGSTSAALSLNTWYCVEMSHDGTATNGTVTARINGTQFTTAAGSTPSVGWGQVVIGVITPATNADIYFDNLAVNDNSGTSQNGFPGLSKIVRATPSGAGDSNTFAQQVGGTAGSAFNYTRVSELTPDGTTSFNADPALGHSDLFTVSVPTIPVGSTINAVMVGGQYANRTTLDATAAFKFQIEKASGGSTIVSAPIIPGTTSMKTNQVSPAGATATASYPITLYNDPDGLPWTPATIASMQIGYIVSVANVNPLSISALWALVDYTPPAGGGGGGASSLMAFI